MKVSMSGSNPLVIRIAGKMNEATELEMIAVPPADVIEVDLGEVTFINSLGIRMFSEWSAKLRAKEVRFSYCPRIFIDQVNMIKGFIPPQSKIISFYVPFYSEASGEEKAVLFSRGDQYSVVDGVPSLTVPKVKDSQDNDMQVDILDRYFAFLENF